jgi:hypothetical protein
MTRAQTGRRRPTEAIQHRTATSSDCEKRVRAALAKLVKTRAPFTVENVCALAGVGKTFIYDKRRPELARDVIAARDGSQAQVTVRAEEQLDTQEASWRERAQNAELLAKTLRTIVKEREAVIGDLTGQLYDPDGNYLVEQLAEMRKLNGVLSRNLAKSEDEIARLTRSLEAARANVKRERERNVTQLYADT